MTAIQTPQAVVIAGPNGAGKTSAAPELLRSAVGIDAFVNADVPEEAPQDSAVEVLVGEELQHDSAQAGQKPFP